MIKAVWGLGFDYRTDSLYDEPQHEDCHAPVDWDDESGKYVCLGCGEEAEVDDDMKKWIEERSETMTETDTCFSCGQKTMVTYKYKNFVTLEWETGHGECTNCGVRFIV